jgi:hypothetical protein
VQYWVFFFVNFRNISIFLGDCHHVQKDCHDIYCCIHLTSRCEWLLTCLSKAQDLVTLELGEAFNDGLSQNLHGCPLSLQCGVPFYGSLLLLPPYGGAPTWGTTADAAAGCALAPIWGKVFLGAKTAPTISPLLAGVAE